MRLLGIFLMSSALTGVGFVFAERRKERFRILEQLRQMIQYLKSQILYSNATLPEAVFEVGERFKNLEKEKKLNWGTETFFEDILRLMEENESQPFSEIWQAAAERIPSGVSLTKGDRENLSALGGKLGYADRNMQECTFHFYQELLDETIKSAKEEVEKMGKLYRTMGVAAGVLWFVLFI